MAEITRRVRHSRVVVRDTPRSNRFHLSVLLALLTLECYDYPGPKKCVSHQSGGGAWLTSQVRAVPPLRWKSVSFNHLLLLREIPMLRPPEDTWSKVYRLSVRVGVSPNPSPSPNPTSSPNLTSSPNPTDSGTITYPPPPYCWAHVAVPLPPCPMSQPARTLIERWTGLRASASRSPRSAA